MVTRREWYERVNAAWPKNVPALTFPEARRAARRLARFAKVTVPTRIVETTGNRYTRLFYGELRINTSRGWHGFVHSLSHLFHRRTMRGFAPHDPTHARLELRLIKEVLRRGWLDGRLKDRPTQVAAVSLVGECERDAMHAQRMLKRAETRLKRATTIVRNWRKKLAAAERRTAKAVLMDEVQRRQVAAGNEPFAPGVVKKWMDRGAAAP